MRTYSIGVLCASLCSSSLLWAVDLETVVRRSLESNPEVRLSADNRLVADQELRQAWAGYLPSVDLSLGYGRENSDNMTTGLLKIDNLTLNRSEASLTLNQMLFDGFSVRHETERQRARVQASAQRVQETSETVALRAIEVYLEILRRRELLELAKNNLVVHQKILDQVRALVEQGAGRKADMQQTEGRAALAAASLASAEGSHTDAETNYRRVTGEAATELTAPAVTQVQAALPLTLEAALKLAEEQHPALAAIRADLDASLASQRQSRANFMPRINVELGASRNENLDGVAYRNDDLTAMLRLRYNLYKGGAHQARLRETAERVNAAKETVNRTQRQVEEETRLAWNALQTARARLTYIERHITASDSVAESYRQQFKLGQRSLLDVLDAENELNNARSTRINARYTELYGHYRLLTATGSLLSALRIEAPAEARP